MKKAIGMAALNFAGVAALWALMQMIFSSFDISDFVRHYVSPATLVLCGGLSGFAAVSAFRREKRKNAPRAVLVIR